jgi:hypothetical protein
MASISSDRECRHAAANVGGLRRCHRQPVAAFLAVLFGNWGNRRGQRELETRSKREETLRVLRWAAELAVSEDDGKAKLGVSQLNALADSDLVDESQLLFIDAALDAVIEEPEDEIDESAGDVDVEVVGPLGGDAPPAPSSVRSKEEQDVEGGDGG